MFFRIADNNILSVSFFLLLCLGCAVSCVIVRIVMMVGNLIQIMLTIENFYRCKILLL